MKKVTNIKNFEEEQSWSAWLEENLTFRNVFTYVLTPVLSTFSYITAKIIVDKYILHSYLTIRDAPPRDPIPYGPISKTKSTLGPYLEHGGFAEGSVVDI